MRKTVVSIAALLGVSIISFAQKPTLPPLPVYPGTEVGSFACGISYYLSSNPTDKGFADIAVVQMGRSNNVPEARQMLCSLQNTHPNEFFRSHGVGYDSNGFVSYPSDSTRVFSFKDVKFSSKQATDSTLLVIRDILAASDGPQAVIVCGDINVAEVKDKLATFCLTIPPVKRSAAPLLLENRSSSVKPDSLVIPLGIHNPVRDMQNTVLPYIGKYVSAQVGYIFLARLDRVLREQYLPYSVSYTAESIRIGTSEADYKRVCECVDSIKRAIYTYGFSKEEMQVAQRATIPAIVSEGIPQTATNARLVEECVSAYLYNTDLASRQALVAALNKQRRNPDRDLQRLNLFAKAVLLSDEDSSAVMKPCSYPNLPEVLSVAYPKKKVKLQTTAKEVVTGGQLYTYSNGVKVIFKKNSDENIHYSVALRGGYNQIPYLHGSEQPYVADVFKTSRIAGMGGARFFELLGTRNISMEAVGGYSSFCIEGNAPCQELSFVLNAIYKAAYERELDKEAFEYFLECETAGADSPELSQNFAEVVSSYIDQRFQNFNDGVFIITGNIDEEKLKTELSYFLSLVSTGRKYARKSAQNLNLGVGRTSSTISGADDQMRISLSCEHHLTAEDFLAFTTACAVMDKTLSELLFDKGMYAEVSGEVRVNPVESFTMNILCAPCPQNGLVAGMVPSRASDEAINIRHAIAMINQTELSEEDFKACKSQAKAVFDRYMSNAPTLIQLVKYRYCDNRDVSSDYTKKIDKITQQQVKEIFTALNSGEIQELITQ